MIHAIAAADEQLGLSKDGKIPWYIPSDSRFWKTKVINQIVIAGYNTFVTHEGPLSSKPVYVLTNSNKPQLKMGIAINKHNLQSVLNQTEDIWVIGGAKTFQSLINKIDKIYLTRVKGNFACDTFFPEHEKDFTLIDASGIQVENGYIFNREIWKRTSIL